LRCGFAFLARDEAGVRLDREKSCWFAEQMSIADSEELGLALHPPDRV
jgi:hypothetical protein